ncbi:SLBB domain-containing protein [Bacteroidota bacterium]
MNTFRFSCLIILIISCNILKGQYSDYQNLLQKVQSGEMSQEEAIIEAKKKGISQSQIEEVKRSAYQKGYTGQEFINDGMEIQSFDTTNLSEIIKESSVTDTQKTSKLEKEYLKYFGYQIFYDKKNMYKPYETGPIDPNYQLGPGDEIIISIWGETERRYKLDVSKEGTIFIDGYGQIVVNGLTIDMLQDKLTKYLSKIYSSLNPVHGNPTTFLDVSLGKLKSIKVFIVGDVRNPGAYFISSYSNAFTALFEAGGPTVDGSMRDVQIIRNGKIISQFDLYTFIAYGKIIKDENLQNNDVIFVPPRISSISLKGEVKKEFIYELKPSEYISDLIAFSGGLKSTADIQRVQILRIIPIDQRILKNKVFDVIDTNLGYLDHEKVELINIPLYDNDIVTIFPVVDYEYKIKEIPMGTRTVIASGHVLNQGRYLLETDMKVLDLLQKTGGFEDNFFWGETYQVRADIFRFNDDGMTQKIIPIRLNELLDGNENENILLKNKDSLVIYNASLIHFNEFVTITGEVKKTGNYKYQLNLTVHDLLLQSGGFTKEAYKYTIEVYRINLDVKTKKSDSLVMAYKVEITPDMLNNFNGNKDFTLKDRDLVVVRHHPDIEYQRIVTLTGEVKFPGQYPILKKNETFIELVTRAGGFTNEAFIPGIKYYRNEDTEIVGDFEKVIEQGTLNRFSITLHDGDYIYIPKHPGTVEVIGFVNNPGYVQYRKGWTMKDYIEAAGSFSFEAHKRKSIIYYPGGNAKKRNALFDPRVKEGSSIYVPQKPEREPINTTQLITNITQITASLATSILIVSTLMK